MLHSLPTSTHAAKYPARFSFPPCIRRALHGAALSVALLSFGSALSATTVISEDFASSASNFSEVDGGTWSVSGGRYVLSSPADSGTNGVMGNISVHNTELSGDYELSALLRITGTSSVWNDAVIIFDYQDEDNYYYVSLNESNDSYTKGVFKVVNGAPTELADITITVASDTDYTIEIARSGSSIVVEVNSSQVASTSDSTFSGGQVGFGSKNDGGQFDNLVVTTSGGGGDTEAPSAPTGLAASNITTSTVDLSWNAATDNVGVTGYKVYTNGANPVSVSGLSKTMTGLSAGTSFTFTVTAVDAASNESGPSSGVSATTSSGSASSYEITGDTDDRGVRDTGALDGISAQEVRVGGSSSSTDQAMIFVFELPSLSSGETITMASLSFGMTQIANTPNGNADLYGLPYQSSTTITASQYYEGSYGGDSNATALENDIMTPSTSVGQIYTSSTGSANLADYLNAQYANGAEGGDYVLLRLNSDVADESNYRYYLVQTANSGNEPVLEFDTSFSGGDTEAPTTPTGLAASNVTTTTVDLDWSASTDNVGVTGYNIYTGGSNPQSVSGVSVTLTGLTPNTSYTFTVSAFDAASNESSQSSGVNVTTNQEQVAAPQFSPAGGTYSGAQSVTITSSTSGATIRYTTDGSAPTSSSGTIYSGAVSVSSSSTLKAIAYKSGMIDSAVTTESYTINASQVAAPQFSPAGGTYSGAQSVAITSSTSGATIRYTTDGSAPTSSSGTVYSSAVSISSSATLKAIAYKSGMTDSSVTSADYTILTQVSAPQFSPGGGTYSMAQSVTITSSTSGATIRYTTDGSAPTSSSGTIYSGAVSISSSAPLKAIAYKSGMTDSSVTSASYVISPGGASFGPNGTHWPSLVDTPFMYDSSVPNVIHVACTWSAISSAISAVTSTQASQGVLIKIAPGTLVGNGISGGGSSNSELLNIGSASWSKRVTVCPRDGYGTVIFSGGVKFYRVKGVCFAGFKGESFKMQGCTRSAVAWTKLTDALRVYGDSGQSTTQVEITEVAQPVAKVTDGDAGDVYTGGGDISDWLIEGCYAAPYYRPAGSASHSDTLQFARTSSNGDYGDITIRDCAYFASSNCAVQTGNIVGLYFEHTYLAAGDVSKSRYPFPSGADTGGANAIINGGGEDFTATDCEFIGNLTINTTPWTYVANTRRNKTDGSSQQPDSGAWTVDTTMSTTNPEMPPIPTDSYLDAIWGAP